MHVYLGDVRAIAGTARLDAVRRYLSQAGLSPIETTHGRALASLMIAEYRDTSWGPYRVAFVTTMATRGHRLVEWQDEFSALVPMLAPDGLVVAFGPYALSRNTAARAFGRERLGIRKYEVSIDVRSRAGRIGVILSEADGTLSLRLEARDPDVLAGPRALLSLAKNLGAAAVADVVLEGRALRTYECVGADPQGELAPMIFRSHMKSVSASRSWGRDDQLQIRPGSPLTDLLLGFEFEPKVLSHDPDFRTAITLDST
jgi:hypothetical protein